MEESTVNNAVFIHIESLFAVSAAATSAFAQASSLSGFVISKTHASGQKPRGRQLNAKVCGSESAIFLILLVTTTMFNNDISQTV